MAINGEFLDDDVTEERYTAMTIQELRERLKHIAGLCWGLSIDLANDLERSQRLEAEVIQLRKKCCAFDKRMAEREDKLSKLSPDERAKYEEYLLKKRMQMADYRKCKKQGNRGNQ